MKRAAILLTLALLFPQASAQQPRPESNNYEIPTDVQPAGGGVQSRSTNYMLDDTIGEGNIGYSASPNYLLNAGYQQGASDTALTMTCTTPAALGTIVRTGDTSVNGCSSTGYCASNSTTCTIDTNSAAGYALSWIISTGTGAAGARTGTGHLNGFAAGNRIVALYNTNNTTPAVMDAAVAPTTAGGVLNNARWAARLSSTSTTTGGGSVTWGSDGVSDTWLRVATGSSVNIANRTSATGPGGDVEKIGFRVIINGTAIVPNDTYRATVTLTAITN